MKTINNINVGHRCTEWGGAWSFPHPSPLMVIFCKGFNYKIFFFFIFAPSFESQSPLDLRFSLYAPEIRQNAQERNIRVVLQGTFARSKEAVMRYLSVRSERRSVN